MVRQVFVCVRVIYSCPTFRACVSCLSERPSGISLRTAKGLTCAGVSLVVYLHDIKLFPPQDMHTPWTKFLCLFFSLVQIRDRTWWVRLECWSFHLVIIFISDAAIMESQGERCSWTLLNHFYPPFVKDETAAAAMSNPGCVLQHFVFRCATRSSPSQQFFQHRPRI